MQKNTVDASLDSVLSDPSRPYCHLDESGDFDFGESGSEYHFQSALVTDAPFPLLEGMQRTKYRLYADHLPLGKSHGNNGYFHATEDAPARQGKDLCGDREALRRIRHLHDLRQEAAHPAGKT